MASKEDVRYVFPEFDKLSEVPDQPKGCLWGFFDKDGKKDQLGTLNLLTPSVVREAAKEIKLGLHVQLDWSMNKLEFPGLGRIPMNHKIKNLSGAGFVAFDDEITINTQTSSQWDGLKHFGLRHKELFYNGVSLEQAEATDVLGIHTFCERGGIVGRGVLIDWVRWWKQTKPDKPLPSATSSHAVPVSEIQEAAAFQNVEFKQGDILLIRTGFVDWYNSAPAEDRIAKVRDNHEHIGLQANADTVRWLYSKHFSAVAGDTFAFECWPPPKECCLHEWLLGYWGTPIGEMWNLEKLSQVCAEVGRWEFFLTSASLNIPGGIASPPGAVAIF